jgi:hypothetical protein
MIATNSTPNALEVKALEVIYQVNDPIRGAKNVTVSMSGVYECKCNSFALYGGCRHTEAVKAQRKTEGRKF